jgi:hypothetical protein
VLTADYNSNSINLSPSSSSQSALHKHTFDFKTSQPRNEESFGVEQKGRISIYDAKNMQAALKIMEDALT